MSESDYKLKITTTLIITKEVSSRNYMDWVDGKHLTGAQAMDWELQRPREEKLQGVIEDLAYVPDEDISITTDVQLVVTSE